MVSLKSNGEIEIKTCSDFVSIKNENKEIKLVSNDSIILKEVK